MKIFSVSFVLILSLLTGSLTLPAQGPADPERTAILRKVLDNARAQVGVTVNYDPAYADLKYPGGDVPADRGVCTDVVIRAFRAAGVDLQQLVHEDMKAHFPAYPHRWGFSHTDTNIDHLRVPNLMTYFARRGKSLPVTTSADDYQPGDLVTWNVGVDLPHIGLVANETAPGDPARHLVVHNIGAGARMEDVLFGFKQTGHYRPF